MKLFDKAKEAAGQAVEMAKEGVEDVQARKDLHLAYVELGKKTFELVGTGALAHPDLAPIVAKIEKAKAELEDEEKAPPEPPA